MSTPKPDEPDLTDEANLNPNVIELLAEGRAVIKVTEDAYRLAAEARQKARETVVATNTMTAVAELMRLCPAVKRLVPYVTPQEDSDADRNPAEFRGMTLVITVPGFNPVRVCVGLTGTQSPTPNVWELGAWQVEKNGVWGGYKTLGEALAHGREDWLRTNRDRDIPF